MLVVFIVVCSVFNGVLDVGLGFILGSFLSGCGFEFSLFGCNCVIMVWVSVFLISCEWVLFVFGFNMESCGWFFSLWIVWVGG